MTKPITIYTLDWVPGGKNGPSGFVRDLRLRWACEEAGLPYAVKTTPLTDKPAPAHLAHQPFGQVPWIEADGLSIFESGAGLLYLARKSEKLLPRDPAGEWETTQWLFAALSSVELVTLPWWFIGLSKPEKNPLDGWIPSRLGQVEAVLAQREWLAAGRFTVADLLMADALRIPKVLEEGGDFPAIHSYVKRVCTRPAFKKAYDAQIEHFAAADENRR